MPHRIGLICCILAVFAVLASCGGTVRNVRPRAEAEAPSSLLDTPPILRNTVGAQTTMRGLEPVLVTGYGLVVGLNGTGSADMPVATRSFMEREMALHGVGQESRGMGAVSPRELLNDPNTAVVFIQAAIPPGSSEGARFDVLVSAAPGTSTTSLEGGRLWTADLYRGAFIPGGPVRQPIARAKGDVFINPFTDPAKSGEDAIVRTTGRILNGGVTVEALDVLLVLDTPSHARARSIVAAVNSHFPAGPADRKQTARGVNEELIEITIPKRFRDDTTRFLQLLLHSRLDQTLQREWALRYARALESRPELAQDLSWALEAVGEHATPYVREMYDHPELAPRLAALRAGAGLGDPLAAPHLRDLAVDGPPALRTRAIELLELLPPDPEVNMALRDLLSAPEMDMRVAAYEALSERFDPILERRRVDDSFILDIVPSDEPMVYVSQQRQPKIVVFGTEPEIDRPCFVSAWSDRLMLTAESPTDELRLFYRDHRTGETTVDRVDPALPELIEYLGHEETPEDPAPGLGLSYSEVVGALHEIWRDGGYAGGFVAEQDRLAVDLLRSISGDVVEERPETSDDQPADAAQQAPLLGAADDEEPAEEPGEERKQYVVPVPGREPPK